MPSPHLISENVCFGLQNLLGKDLSTVFIFFNLVLT